MHQVLSHAAERFAAELEGIDTALSQVHPEGKLHLWTMQQVVEHLILSLRTTREQLEKRLLKGRIATRTRRTRADWLMQLMVLSLGHMPLGVPAETATVPIDDLPPATGRDLLRLLQAELALTDAVFDNCRQQFGMERVGQHFLLGPLRIDQWRRYHALHLRHHAGQLQRIRHAITVQVVRTPAIAHASSFHIG